MVYSDIISYFESDDKIAELLKKLTEDYFDIIDEIIQLYQNDALSTFDELIKTKTKLSGIIASLEPIYSKGLSLKKQKEYRRFVELKESGEKFSAASAEKEAKDFVKNYRDVRDIVRGYLNSANAVYYDIRDTLDRKSKEFNREKEND